MITERNTPEFKAGEPKDLHLVTTDLADVSLLVGYIGRQKDVPRDVYDAWSRVRKIAPAHVCTPVAEWKPITGHPTGTALGRCDAPGGGQYSQGDTLHYKGYHRNPECTNWRPAAEQIMLCSECGKVQS